MLQQTATRAWNCSMGKCAMKRVVMPGLAGLPDQLCTWRKWGPGWWLRNKHFCLCGTQTLGWHQIFILKYYFPWELAETQRKESLFPCSHIENARTEAGLHEPWTLSLCLCLLSLCSFGLIPAWLALLCVAGEALALFLDRTGRKWGLA